MLPRPSHPEPYVRDDRETPLCVGRDASDVEVIWVQLQAIFLIFRNLLRNGFTMRACGAGQPQGVTRRSEKKDGGLRSR